MYRKILTVLLSIGLATTGCRDLPSAKPLNKIALEREISADRSILLLNFTFVGAGTTSLSIYPVTSFGTSPDSTRIEVEQLAGDTAPRPVQQVFGTSDQDLEKGWSFFPLEAGQYVVTIRTDDGCTHSVGVSVPRGRHVIYLGAYQWAQHRADRNQSARCRGITDISAQKQAAAQNLAAQYFSSLGPLLPSHDANPPVPSLPLGVGHREEAALEPHDWVAEGTERGAAAVPPLCIGGGSGTPIDVVFLALCIGTAAATLTSAGVGTVSGQLEKNKWQPCEEKVRKALTKIDLAARARSALDQVLESRGFKPAADLSRQADLFEAGEKSAVKSLFAVRFGKFRWHETKQGLFLAADVDGSLWDIRSRSSSGAWSLKAEQAGWPNAESRPLSALCRDDTERAVTDEVARLYRSLVGRVTRDFVPSAPGRTAEPASTPSNGQPAAAVPTTKPE